MIKLILKDLRKQEQNDGIMYRFEDRKGTEVRFKSDAPITVSGVRDSPNSPRNPMTSPLLFSGEFTKM
jgi:hypothetical protein